MYLFLFTGYLDRCLDLGAVNFILEVYHGH